MRGVLQILKSKPDGLAAREVLNELEKLVPPTDFEKSTYPKRPDVRRYEKIVRFGTIGPVKAGWLVKDKEHWTIMGLGDEKSCKLLPRIIGVVWEERPCVI